MIKNCPMRHENGNCIPAGGFCTANKNICEALLNAYRMGKAQLSKEGTTSDTISRRAAIDALDVLCQEHRYRIPGKRETYSEYNEAWQDALDRAEGAIFNLPPAKPEPHEGEWLPDNNNAYEMRFVCSCCKESEVVPTIGFTKYKPLWDFCPNCGADMRGEKDG